MAFWHVGICYLSMHNILGGRLVVKRERKVDNKKSQTVTRRRWILDTYTYAIRTKLHQSWMDAHGGSSGFDEEGRSVLHPLMVKNQLFGSHCPQLTTTVRCYEPLGEVMLHTPTQLESFELIYIRVCSKAVSWYLSLSLGIALAFSEGGNVPLLS